MYASSWGEEPSPQLKLELTLARKPPVIHPRPDPKTAEQDAEQAIAEVETRKRDERLMRETAPAAPRRPDLHYDVLSGIQSRGLQDALRRR